jgi:hypothetical protein
MQAQFTPEKRVESVSCGFHALLVKQPINADKTILAKASDLLRCNLQGALQL